MADQKASIIRTGSVVPDQPGVPQTNLVDDIRRARGRQTRRARLLFVATWLAIIGGLAFALSGRFDSGFVFEWLPFILGGIGITILVSFASIIFATLFALVGALGRLSKRAPIYAASTLYVSLVRGTPLIVQVLFVYLALPQIIPAVAKIPAIYLGIFALSFNYGAYMTEIFRAGIQAVSRGQTEAAQALGMTDSLLLRRIVLPQATRIVIPAIGNEFIALIKDSALVSVIAVQELLWRAQRAGSQDFKSFEAFTVAALVYWALTIIFSLFQDRLEKRMARGDR
ncbi:MAG TPA: amino acid ABC transporter permease [Candidatus Limnocylindrales bacterium]|nr:amino acid ABC transporter permease [Candidatus Limnocylindrales bacterium]